jgi:hypothetical protein
MRVICIQDQVEFSFFFWLIYSHVRHTGYGLRATGYGYKWIGCLIGILNDSRQCTWTSLFLLTHLQYLLFATAIPNFSILCIVIIVCCYRKNAPL